MTLQTRIADEFPSAARDVASAVPTVADSRVVAGRAVVGKLASSKGMQAFLPNDFREPLVLSSGAREVVLRPLNARAARAGMDTASRAYRGAFEGIDVLRGVADGAANERLVIETSGTRTIEYQIVSMRGFADVVNDGRTVRFISTDRTAPDFVLSAPSMIDVGGAPAQSARWSLAEENGRITTIRLTIDDTQLRHPLMTSFSLAAKATSSTTGRARVVSAAPQPLAGGGTISGSLRDDSTGNAIANGVVHFYSTVPDFVGSATTNGDGDYTSPELAPGSYYVAARPYQYQPEVYDNIACPGGECPVTSGNLVSVTANANHGGIDFRLLSDQARVSGNVKDSQNNAVLADVGIRFYNTSGVFVGSTVSDAGGNYTVTLSASGNYYARSFNFTHSGYVDILYNNIQCSGCDPTTGTAISASLGSLTNGINFALPPRGGSIQGMLQDAGTGAPIAGESVFIFNSAGQFATFATSDSTGHYESFNGLKTGNYFAATSPGGYFGELYNNIPCDGLSCDPTTGTAIAVTFGTTTSDKDFSLVSTMAQVTGTVTDASTTNALGSVPVVFYDADGNAVAVGFSDTSTGRYSVRLDAGTYYARSFATASNYATYIDELYNNIPCVNCNPVTGTTITATAGQTTTNIDFALTNNGGSISGRLTNAATSSPIADGGVNIYDSNGTYVTSGQSDANGDYTSTNPLISGNYYVVATPFGYNGELYNDISCPSGNCIVTQGTAVSVTLGQNTPNINFALTGTIGIITGRVIATSTNVGITNANVLVYNSSGSLVTTAQTDEVGDYSVAVTSSGNYFARTVTNGQYSDELYNNISCSSSCTVTAGTAISVTVGQSTNGINFSLDPGACPDINLSPDSLPDGTVGTPYSQTISAAGGLSPYTFSVTPGTLPPGLSLASSTGVISGTPTNSGTFGFSIDVVDANGCSGTKTYSIHVAGQPPVIDDVFPNSGSQNGNTTVTISGSGFGNLQSVEFDGSPATIVTFDADEITVRTPAHALGTVDVTVSTTDGTATAPGAYTYTNQASVTLTSSLNPSTYGQSVTFTATLNQPLASGTMTFYDGTTVLAVKTIVPATLGDDDHPPTAAQPTTFTTSALTAGTHPIKAVYSGDANYGSATSNTVNQVVNKAPRVVTLSVAPSPSTYGDTITLTATVSPTAEASTVIFKDGATVLGTSTINGSGIATFQISTLTAGTHSLTAGTPDSANYLAGTSNTVSHLVNKATPVFTDLSSPTIVLGTPTTVISGNITYGSLIPTGSVTITVNAVSYSAAIAVDGSFSATVNTSTLTPTSAGYAISFSYPGDSNFNAITGSSLLTVTYATTPESDPQPKNSGATISVRIQIRDFAGNNLSSSSIAVAAYGVRLTTSATWLPAQEAGGGSNLPLVFQNAGGGQYKYQLKTTGLAAGVYYFGFTIQNDPVIHLMQFTIQ
ncbi:MAG TPA: carboxypeptidase regulatory-like domain-containing protein [Thermoanaerobaculia bacterium]|nr:carboxypeptidase regulatory-like domain-containing protein [Thermoanaerobaculia bacterium]